MHNFEFILALKIVAAIVPLLDNSPNCYTSSISLPVTVAGKFLKIKTIWYASIWTIDKKLILISKMILSLYSFRNLKMIVRPVHSIIFIVFGLSGDFEGFVYQIGCNFKCCLALLVATGTQKLYLIYLAVQSALEDLVPVVCLFVQKLCFSQLEER